MISFSFRYRFHSFIQSYVFCLCSRQLNRIAQVLRHVNHKNGTGMLNGRSATCHEILKEYFTNITSRVQLSLFVSVRFQPSKPCYLYQPIIQIHF